MIENRSVAIAGALLALFGVLLGAFGAHVLRDTLGPERLGWWQTGVQYQMWHAVGLVGLASVPAAKVRLAGALLIAGTVLFSGSLYLMALAELRWLGMVTPIGGSLMIGGWGVAAVSLLRPRGRS